MSTLGTGRVLRYWFVAVVAYRLGASGNRVSPL